MSTQSGRTEVIHYDSFTSDPGYTLADYRERWENIYGLGELADNDTRVFDNASLTVSAVPFTTSADQSVFDHIKYFAASTRRFAVPRNGSITFEATIQAQTPGTEKGRVIKGSYGPGGSYPDGAPFTQEAREPQQANASMHLIDFNTGQLFDWLVGEHSALSLVERLPSEVTGSPVAAGKEQIYTQIIDEHGIEPGPHRYGIRFWRTPDGAGADYLLDGAVVSRIDRVGVPLDKQGVAYTGTWPSMGGGEELGSAMNEVVIAHGLFSLLDAFPFQHEEAPELSVSIPVSERIFGQGAIGRFKDFTVTVHEN